MTSAVAFCTLFLSFRTPFSVIPSESEESSVWRLVVPLLLQREAFQQR
jgi:hypothetical protein